MLPVVLWSESRRSLARKMQEERNVAARLELVGFARIAQFYSRDDLSSAGRIYTLA